MTTIILFLPFWSALSWRSLIIFSHQSHFVSLPMPYKESLLFFTFHCTSTRMVTTTIRRGPREKSKVRRTGTAVYRHRSLFPTTSYGSQTQRPGRLSHVARRLIGLDIRFCDKGLSLRFVTSYTDNWSPLVRRPYKSIVTQLLYEITAVHFFTIDFIFTCSNTLSLSHKLW